MSTDEVLMWADGLEVMKKFKVLILQVLKMLKGHPSHSGDIPRGLSSSVCLS